MTTFKTDSEQEKWLKKFTKSHFRNKSKVIRTSLDLLKCLDDIQITENEKTDSAYNKIKFYAGENKMTFEGYLEVILKDFFEGV